MMSLGHKCLPHNLRRFLYSRYRPHYYNNLVFRRTLNSGSEYSFAIFDELECIFIHVPRTGGNSIIRTLLDGQSPGHLTAAQYQIIFNRCEFRKYYKFAFVRNPWDRLVSAFHFLKHGGMNIVDSRWADENLAGYDFEMFVEERLRCQRVNEVHFRPQVDFICGYQGKPVLDYLGHFESYEEDFHKIATRLGLKNAPLRLNTSQHKDYREYYTDQLRQIVAEYYAGDIELFDYKF